MELRCIVCNHIPGMLERYVKLESWLKGADSSYQGISVMVCNHHLPQEMRQALQLDNPSFVKRDCKTITESEEIG